VAVLLVGLVEVVVGRASQADRNLNILLV
jgi:hypothetical protein